MRLASGWLILTISTLSVAGLSSQPTDASSLQQQTAKAWPAPPCPPLPPELLASPERASISRKLQQYTKTAILSTFLTVGGSESQAPLGTPAAELAAVAGTPVDSHALTPEQAAQVQQAQSTNLEGDAPDNEEPYTFNLSNPYAIPNQNVAQNSTGIGYAHSYLNESTLGA